MSVEVCKDRQLAGQTALVTGGSRGIGRAVCLKLASLGARVVINYIKNSEAAESVKNEIEAEGGQAETLCFDVSNADLVDQTLKDFFSSHERLEILVNNAGISVDGLLLRTKEEDWQRNILTNLSSCFYCCRAVSKTMMKARYGRIINVSSIIGQMGNAGQTAYAASKAGVFGFTKSLAREIGSRGITVNAVAPGYIKTDMTASITEEQTREMLSRIPLGRLGDPEDVAAVIGFLVLPEASYITGQILAVNGGMYM